MIEGYLRNHKVAPDRDPEPKSQRACPTRFSDGAIRYLTRYLTCASRPKALLRMRDEPVCRWQRPLVVRRPLKQLRLHHDGAGVRETQYRLHRQVNTEVTVHLVVEIVLHA